MSLQFIIKYIYAYIDFKVQVFSFWSFSSEKENNIGGISFEGIPSDFNYQISFNWIYYNHMKKIKYDLIVPL